jgi:adenylate kinase family enzyme
VFIVGLSGSGKSTLARQVGARCGAPVFELDWIAWGTDGERGLLPLEVRTARAEEISSGDSWVAEGVYAGSWTRSFMERADVIVWLNVPMPVALWRVFCRHVKAELRRDNRFPGWRKLFRFMRLVSRQYRGTAEPISPDDPPLTRASIAAALTPYSGKVVKGRGEDARKRVAERLERRTHPFG